MQSKSVFPLPLVPWEHYMWKDDRPRYPMTFVIRLEVSGELQREPFLSALRTALDRHPLLKSRIIRVGWRGWCWLPSEADEPLVDWTDADTNSNADARLILPLGEFIDLTREVGLRVWARAAFEQARLTFQFHHAATDGLGAIQFLGDLLAAYGRATVLPGEEVPEFGPLEISRLRTRGDHGPARVESWRQRFADLKLFVEEAWHLFARQPKPLAVRTLSDAERSIEFPSLLTRRLNRHEAAQLREFASKRGVSPNDLYLREMFLTLHDWNRERSSWRPSHWLRIGMPVSMRTEQHDGLPAANVLSMFFVARQLGDRIDTDELLKDLHQQTDRIVNRRLGWYFATGVNWSARIPGALNFSVSERHCLATVILANVGDIRRQMSARFPLQRGKIVAGNIVLESFEGAAPVRPQTHAGVSLGTYAGELIVNLHPDAWHLSRADADELLDRFVNRLRAVAGPSRTAKEPQRQPQQSQ